MTAAGLKSVAEVNRPETQRKGHASIMSEG